MSATQEKKKNIHEHSSINKKGFISAYYFILFLEIAALISVQLINCRNRMDALSRLEDINSCLAEENRILLEVKCWLSEPEEERSCPASWNCMGSEIIVHTGGDVPEQIIIALNADHSSVYDYSVIR